MSETRRQQLARALKDAPASLYDLADVFNLKLKTAEAEVQHAARSSAPARLRVEQPAECLACGFVFRERRRLTAPSRCPRCRSESTTAPLLRIR